MQVFCYCLYLVTIAASLSLLPFSIALFPQMTELPVEKLESKFHHIKNESGQAITTVYFNRGL
jgi:hypothetical protein